MKMRIDYETKAEETIRRYKLVPHPEGGWYREAHRSGESLRLPGGRIRSACTAILFLLSGGEISRWHRVVSDELWHFCEGDSLELHKITSDLSRYTIHRLGSDTGKWFHVIPCGCWQAARSTGSFSLVTCVVSPGFDFADFRLLSNEHGIRDEVVKRHPGAESFC